MYKEITPMPETLPGSSLMSASREQMVNLVSPWSRSLGSQAGDRDCRRRACETGGIQQRSALRERNSQCSVEHITSAGSVNRLDLVSLHQASFLPSSHEGATRAQGDNHVLHAAS